MGLDKSSLENNDDWAQQIIDNAEIDGDGKLDFNDFMLASIDLSRQSFYNYCNNAYELLFDNEEESVEVQHFVNLLCEERNLKEPLVKDFLGKIDDLQEGHNYGFIHYDQLFKLFISELGLLKTEHFKKFIDSSNPVDAILKEVESNLKDKFDRKNIGSSRRFLKNWSKMIQLKDFKNDLHT